MLPLDVGGAAAAFVRATRRRSLGLPEKVGVAEPADLEGDPEKYGYVGGKSPLERAEERRAAASARAAEVEAARYGPFRRPPPTPEQAAESEKVRALNAELDDLQITDRAFRTRYLVEHGVDVPVGEMLTATGATAARALGETLVWPFVKGEEVAKAIEKRLPEVPIGAMDPEGGAMMPLDLAEQRVKPPVGQAVETANRALGLPFEAAQAGGQHLRESLGQSYFDPTTPGGRTRENVLQLAEMLLPIAALKGAGKAPKLARGVAAEARRGVAPRGGEPSFASPVDVLRGRRKPAPEQAAIVAPELTAAERGAPERQAAYARAYEAARAIRPEDEIRLANEPRVRPPGAEAGIADQALREARAKVVEAQERGAKAGMIPTAEAVLRKPDVREPLPPAPIDLTHLADTELRALVARESGAPREMREAAVNEVGRRAGVRMEIQDQRTFGGERQPRGPAGVEQLIETRDTSPPPPRWVASTVESPKPPPTPSPVSPPRSPVEPPRPAPEAPAPPPPAAAKFRPADIGPLDALRGERGALLIPGAAELREAGRRIGGAAKTPIDFLRRAARESEVVSAFRLNPKIEEHQLKPGYTVGDALARARNAKVGTTRSGPEAARTILTGLSKEESAAFRAFLTAKDGLRNATEGKLVPGGKTPADMQADIARAEQTLGPERLAEYERRYREVADEAFEELLVAERVKPEMYREDWVKNIALERAAERLSGAPTSAQSGIGQFMPGSARKRRGTSAAIEDPIRALALAKQEAEASLVDYLFAREVTGKFSQNQAIRIDGPDAIPADVALYAFDRRGGTPNLLVGRAAAEAIQQALSQEKGPGPHRTRSGPGGRFWKEPVEMDDAFYYGPPGQQKAFYALPRRLAEGLAEEGSMRSPAVARAMAKANSAIMHSLLSFPVLNLGYHVRQVMQDAYSAYQRVPAGYGGTFAKSAVKHLGELTREFWRVYAKGERSPLLRELERQNLLGTNFETMFEEMRQLGDVEHIVTERALPLRDRSTGAKLKAVVFSVSNLGDVAGKVRESTFMQALADTAQRAMPEASREAAVAWARRVVGQYDKRSQAGAYFAPWTQFTRWFMNAGAEMTVRLARDPLTGERNLRGLWMSPLPKLAAFYAIIHAINHRDEETAKVADEVLPKGDRFGIVTPWRTEDGRPVILEVDSYLNVAGALLDTAGEAIFGEGPAQAAEDAARWFGGRVTPAARTPVELLMGKKIQTGAPIVPGRFKNLPPEAQAELNAERGGLPIPFAQQYALEQFSHIPGAVRRTRDPGTDAWDRLRPLGSPFRAVDPESKLYEEGIRGAGPAYRDLVREYLKPAPERNLALVRKRMHWLIERGHEEKTIRATITRTVNAYREAKRLTPAERKAKRYEGIRNPLAPAAADRAEVF